MILDLFSTDGDVQVAVVWAIFFPLAALPALYLILKLLNKGATE